MFFVNLAAASEALVNSTNFWMTASKFFTVKLIETRHGRNQVRLFERDKNHEFEAILC